MKKCIALLVPVVLTGCAAPSPDALALKSVSREVRRERVNVPVIPKPVQATFGYETEPRVLKAYEAYTKRGVSKVIQYKGYKTIPFSTYGKPLLACAPLRLCVVQLQAQEKINHIDIGDSENWLLETSLVGRAEKGSYQVTLKPKLSDIATDLIITTNKRSYQIGLVSKKGEASEILSFYYPDETLKTTNEALASSQQQDSEVDVKKSFSLNKLNFDYSIKHNGSSLSPVRVFDDGEKSYIQMPADIKHHDLPVLYVIQGDKSALINYRYHFPYYVVDGLFDQAYLLYGQEQKLWITRG